MINTQTKHKAYFDVTLPNPPKKSTVYDIMERCRKTAEFKLMPFIQLVGDQPVYALILEIKNKFTQYHGVSLYNIFVTALCPSFLLPSC